MRAHRRCSRSTALAGALIVVLAAGAAGARDLAGEGDRRLELQTTLKATALVQRMPDDPVLFPERVTAASLWRLRLELLGRAGPDLTADLAYEQRLRVSAPAAAGEGLLVAEAPPPWRIRSLDAAIARSGGTLAWSHELDRASVAARTGPAEFVAGRQAIGWGRGALFGAVDLFSPFAPLEADREWRRGVDALRAEVRIAPRLSAEAVAAFGRSLDTSILAARLRGYAGAFDAELVLGRRARDLLAGATASAAVGQAELHGEVAVFRAPEDLPVPGPWARVAVKAVAGGSWRLALGNGVPVFLEYHYSGFGAERAGDLPALLLDARFASRYLRGDFQIAGRHALALLASYEQSPELSGSLLALVSPVDGSGVVAPTVRLDLGDRLTVTASLYLPWGSSPRGGVPRSEYGGTPLAGLVQVRIYD